MRPSMLLFFVFFTIFGPLLRGPRGGVGFSHTFIYFFIFTYFYVFLRIFTYFSYIFIFSTLFLVYLEMNHVNPGREDDGSLFNLVYKDDTPEEPNWYDDECERPLPFWVVETSLRFRESQKTVCIFFVSYFIFFFSIFCSHFSFFVSWFFISPFSLFRSNNIRLFCFVLMRFLLKFPRRRGIKFLIRYG